MEQDENGKLQLDEHPVEPWFQEGLRFQCTGCGKCCTGSPGYVFLSETDMHRFASYFQLSIQDFANQYTQQVDGLYALLDRPNSQDCIFLKNNQCSVYETRPTQCRTFPWWIQHLREPSDWEEAKMRCEGIDHVDAPIIPSIQIQEQCLTYLDNLLDQNFSL
jgi:Fe-S-cluster containining protein